MTDHASLIERLEKAEAGSREFDALVTVALRLDCKRGLPDDLQYLQAIRRDGGCAPGTYWYVCRSGKSLRTSDPVTTSIYATVALVERALPGSLCLAGTRGMKGDRARAAIIPAHGRMVGAKHRTPAMALCIALLKALPAASEGSVGTKADRPKSQNPQPNSRRQAE